MLTKLVTAIVEDRRAALFVEEVLVPAAVTSALSWVEKRLFGGGSTSGGYSSASRGEVDWY